MGQNPAVSRVVLDFVLKFPDISENFSEKAIDKPNNVAYNSIITRR